MPGVGNKYFRINPFVKNTRVLFVSFVDTKVNDEGENIEEWKVASENWAYVETVSGAEISKDGVLKAEEKTLFHVNYHRGFKPTVDMLIYYNGDIYNIQNVDDERQEHKEVVIKAIKHKRSQGIMSTTADVLEAVKEGLDGKK